MSDWIDLKSAVEKAQDMIATVLVTISRQKGKSITSEQFMIEVHGVKEMFSLTSNLEKLKKSRKIKSWNAQNIINLPSFLVEEFLTNVLHIKVEHI